MSRPVRRRSALRRRGTAVLVVLALAAPAGAALVTAGSAQAEALRGSAVAAPIVAAAPAAARGKVRSIGAAMYGRPRSGLAWHSGFWTGGSMSTARMSQAEAWRGRPFDFVTVYPDYSSWASIADSEWVPQLYQGFRGRLSYGLPLLPSDRPGQWSDVLSGAHDAVFRGIARQLVAYGRGDSVIRVGLEANGDWFAWGATAATASEFKAAFRRVVTLMRAEAPHLTFWFDTSSGFRLIGSPGRIDALTVLYPGDAYVDGISMDHYDTVWLPATSSAKWAVALKPGWAPGLADAVAFARAHRKGFAVPEWGLRTVNGQGDNPYFIQQMHAFFAANADVLVFESYFSEPDAYIQNALWGPTQLPRSADLYRRLF